MIVTYNLSESAIRHLELAFGMEPLKTRKQEIHDWAQTMIDKHGWLIEVLGTERVMDWVTKDVDFGEKPGEIVAVIYEALELLAYSFDTVSELVASMDRDAVGRVYAEEWSKCDEAYKSEPGLVATTIEDYRALAVAAHIQEYVREFSILLSKTLDDLEQGLEEAI